MGSPSTLSPAPRREGRRARRRPVPRGSAVVGRLAPIPTPVYIGLILALAVGLRVWRLDHVGFNSDEAVYAGQAASLANDPALEPFFPIFRAHPLLFQTVLSVGFRLGFPDGFERLTVVLVGAATVYLVYELGRLLYGREAGLLAAVLMALMPYHVVVTRQVLLDGPMTLFATLTLVLLARYAISERPAWLYAAGAAMGLAFLSKETSIVLLGAVYAFLALTPQLRIRLRDLALSMGLTAMVIAPFPLTLVLAGRTGTGESYLTWQLFRRPNHDWLFYPTTVPEAIGPLVLLAAALGLWLLRRESLVAGDAPPVLGRGAGRLLLPLAGEGVPVPAADRSRDRRAGRPGDHSLGSEVRPAGRGDSRREPAHTHLGPGRGRRPRHLPRRLRRPSGRTRGG